MLIQWQVVYRYVVQMPILIGFYHAIMRTPELQEHANFLWFDLSCTRSVLYYYQSLQVSQHLFNKKLSMVGHG